MIRNKKSKTNMAIKTMALLSISAIAAAGGGNPSVSLTQTVGTDLNPGACGVDQVLSVAAGTQVNFCYTITNTGDVALNLHDLDTTAYGALLSAFEYDLIPMDSVSINDIRTVSNNVINEAIWTASTPVVYNTTVLTDGDFVFNDISGTGTPLDVPDDGEANIVIPFSFQYFGASSSDLRVGDNGAALFGVTTGEVEFTSSPLPTADLPIMAPLWMDLIASLPNGNIYWQAQGVSPNQTLTVQWHEIKVWGGVDAENVTFQIVLYEGTNEVHFVYPDLTFGGDAAGNDAGAGASIGIDSGDGINAVQYSLSGSTLIADMTTLVFTPPVNVFNANDSSTAAVSVLTPQVAVNPGFFDVTVSDVDVSASEILVISNEGQGILEWSVDEAAAAVALPRPISYFMPEPQANQSLGPAPMSFSSSKSFKQPGAQKELLGGVTAYAAQVFPNNAFGTMNLTDASFTPILDPMNGTFYAGDLVGGLTTMYGINNDDSSLYSINVADGTTTLIGPSTPIVGQSWTGISEDPTTGTVYASGTDCATGTLYTIDVSTGAATEVGPMTNTSCVIDLAVSASGQIYAHDIVTDTIVAIDKMTGAGTVIGATGFDANFAQGMDFDSQTNILYLAAYNNGIGDTELRTVDLQTGATTVVGTQAPQDEFGAFAVATTGNSCYSPEDIPWLSMTNTSGVVGSGDTDEVMVDFDATGLAVGLYEANICVFTNDIDEPLVSVPVILEVSDLIFASGFEAPNP